MSRSSKAILNSGTRLLYEIVAVICSFILPRLILSEYGSDVNGLVLSISRFLSISTFIDAAIGGVTRAAMYKPLADKDYTLLGKIFQESNNFYLQVSKIFVAYTLFIACILPFVNGDGFTFWDIFLLTLAISLSTYIQFLIGATNNVLVYADQKVYLISTINTVTIILNTIATVVLIKLGCSIHVVKLTTSIVFAIRPFFTYIYCKKHYPLIRSKYDGRNLIPNKWSGFSHQIAETVHTNADTIVLTCLSIYSNVSIYAIYALITDGLTKLMECLRTGMGPGFGNMLVTESVEKVRSRFAVFDLVINIGSCILFSSAMILIVPFVMLYTQGIIDADYNQPLFALLLVLSTLLHNMKNPYLVIIFAAGHFKQTQKSANIEMLINVILSILFVYVWGLNGVAIGTILAMLYRVIYCSQYLNNNVIYYSSSNFVKKVTINLVFVLSGYFIFTLTDLCKMNTFLDWVVFSMIVVPIVSILTFAIYFAFFRKDCLGLLRFIKGQLHIKR